MAEIVIIKSQQLEHQIMGICQAAEMAIFANQAWAKETPVAKNTNMPNCVIEKKNNKYAGCEER